MILFVADGNGVNTNYGTRLYQGQLEGGYGDEFELSHEKWACEAYRRGVGDRANSTVDHIPLGP